MATTSKNRDSSSWKYEVFLSFNREDTGKSFTDHLYAALNRIGLSFFRHDKTKKGLYIEEDELLNAIEESRISIVIFSRRYAACTECLNELVRIMECKQAFRQIVVPVFYDVEPCHVRWQSSLDFREAFDKHEEAFKGNPNKVLKWRAAMKEASNHSGFHLNNGHESVFIQDIVRDISNKLRPSFGVIDQFVGLDWRLEKIMSSHIGFGSDDDVKFIGICGMGGIGKTTLARAVHDQMSVYFEGSSFLANVRETSQEGRLVSLQKQLLCQVLEDRDFKIWDVNEGVDRIRRRVCCKKVLVIIDDVDHMNQLNSLVGSRDWFGPGSKIIITTRDEHLLVAHNVDSIYMAECLNQNEALQLFSMKAFKNLNPLDGYLELSKQVLSYCNGLPLALEVLGSFFSGRRSAEQWTSALERLKENSNKEILDRLQIGFDGLEETEKDIFLDIAYFFRGKKKDLVTKVLDGCGFYPDIGINVLIEKCLVSVSQKNEVLVHDLLQEMAKKIVKEESPRDPGRRSRLWSKDEVYHVLQKNKGTEEVQGITHKFPKEGNINSSHVAFSSLVNLRILKISDLQLSQGLDFLSNELRYLEWHGFSLNLLPPSFEPEKIVLIDLSYSRICQLWSGIKALNKLKIIDVSHCQNLTTTPDFTGTLNLETLIFKGCTKLSKIHPSIGFLKRLMLLNLTDCESLLNLPSFAQLVSLEVCILSGCSKLRKFPEIVGKMDCLKELDLSGTAITEFHPSVFRLMENLEVLSFRGCKGPPSKYWQIFSRFWSTSQNYEDCQLLNLPSLSGLRLLKKLDLSECHLPEGAIPYDLGSLPLLTKLNLSENDFSTLPTSINLLENLSLLYLNDCKSLKSFPQLPPSVGSVYACNCTSLEAQQPNAVKLVSFSSNSTRRFSASSVSREVDRKVADAKRLKHRQVISNTFNLVYPGSKIPSWFSHQTTGSSMSMQKPENFLKSEDNRLIGLAICCLFYIHENQPSTDDYDVIHFILKGASIIPVCLLNDKAYKAMPDHLWLFFVSQEFFNVECEDDSSRLEFSFLCSGKGLKVRKLGVRPVYKLDEDEFKEMMSKSTRVFHEDFLEM